MAVSRELIVEGKCSVCSDRKRPRGKGNDISIPWNERHQVSPYAQLRSRYPS